MDINNNPDYTVPHIDAILADYLKEQFSADKQLEEGLLADPNVVRSEQFLLGFLGGLGYSRNVIDVMLRNQVGIQEDVEDVTESYL